MVKEKHPPQNPDRKTAEARSDGEAEETPSSAQDEKPAVSNNFPIVGIGASAGGLETFGQFFTDMPADSGMAFVLVQHLDPTHKSILGDLVKRYTRMQVFEVQDGMTVKPNCTYIIPPNREMALLHGTLHLIEPTAPRGLRLPIDFFFRSLAQDQKERAICVVLSGTGTDGTRGLKEVKAEGGLVMVQSPESAKYDGMPRSAIATGIADFISPPDTLREQLIAYVHHAFGRWGKKVTPPSPKDTDYLQKVFILLRNQTGHDFSFYKPNTIIRRIERRMSVHQIDQINHYVRYLQQNPLEVETLFKELLIGVSNFFRDPEAFAALEEKVIPALFEDRTADQPVRVWVPGCSTGEEAYSIAMLIREHMMEALKQALRVQIFATDIDSEAIETARTGLYPDSIAMDVSPERLKRYFDQEDHSFRIKKVVRDMVVFAVQNVIKDPPFSNLNLISCRNLLIYMGPELQKRLFPLFHYALNQNGSLFLGTSETIGDFADLFAVIDRKWKLFQRKGEVSSHRVAIDFPAVPPFLDVPGARRGFETKGEEKISFRELTERILLKSYTPACLIINERCDVLYVHGRTGKYLEPASGEANLNILAMAREGLRLELTTAIRKALAQKKDVRYEGMRVKTNGGNQVVNLTVKPMLKPPNLRGLMMILIEDRRSLEPTASASPSGVSAGTTGRVAELEQELSSTKEYLQTTIEELETTNEELKSTNEELQSANEELQSTNEELETSKEELQSVNEELVTVNSELETKLAELSKANNDMNNLLASTAIGTLFLDNALSIQRFTPATAQVINLIPSDIGRPLSHVVTNLQYDQLVQDTQEVLDTLVSKETEVQTRAGTWYSMRIMPYRTLENVIDGAVVTFVNIDEQKRKLTRAIEQSPNIVMITDIKGKIEYVNPKFTETTGYPLEEVVGQNPRLLQSGEHSQAFYQQLWNTLIAGKEWRGEFHNKKKNGELYWESVSISPVKNAQGKITHFAAFKEDITERKREKIALLRVNRMFRALSEWQRALASTTDAEKALGDFCRMLVERADYALVWIGLVASEGAKRVKPVAQAGVEPGTLDTISGATMEGGEKLTETALRTGRPVVIAHIPSHPTDEPWKEAASKRGYNSFIAVPLGYGDRSLGALSLYSTEPGRFDEPEIELLTTIADYLSFAIRSFRVTDDAKGS